MSTLQTFRRHRKPLGGALAALMAVWQIGQPLQAADVTWNAGTSANFDWDNGLNWGGTAPGIGDTAILPFVIPNPGPLPNPSVLTLTTTSSANLVDFKNNYILSAGTLNLGAGGLRADLGIDATIGSTVAGTAGLTKLGGGSVRLTGTNTYSGVTTIANGSLIITDAAALGGDTSAISILTNNNTPSNTNLLGLGGGSLVLDGTASGFTFSRNVNLEGRGPIGDRGAAIQSLGNNTLSGTINTAVSPLSPTTFRNSRINSVNGTLTLAGTVNVGGTLATTYTVLGGNITAGVNNFNLTGTLTGTGSIQKSGAGTLFLNPTSMSGFAGGFRIRSDATGGQQSSVRVNLLTVGGTSTSVFGANTGSGTSAPIELDGGILEFRNEGNLDYNSLAGGKNVYLRSSSTLFTGPGEGGDGINGTTTLGLFRMAQGQTPTFRSRNGYGVTLGTWSQESTNGNNTVQNEMGGTLTFTGSAWQNGDGSARTLVMQGVGTTVIQGGLIGGGTAKDLAKRGTGTLVIQGTNSTLSGSVDIQNGALRVTDFRSVNNNTGNINLGSSASNTNLNGNNNFGSGTLIIGGVGTPTAAGLTTSKVVNLNGTTQAATILASQSGTAPVIFNAPFTATGTGSKLLTLGGTSAVNNVINGAIPNSGVLGSTTLLTASASGQSTLALNSVAGLAPLDAITGFGIQPGTTISSIDPLTRVVTLSLPTTAGTAAGQSMTSANLVGPTAIAKTGPGTWMLGGTNTNTGATTLSNGTLKLRANAAASTILEDTAPVTFDAANGYAGATLELVGQNATANVETLGRLTLTQGANTVRLTQGTGVASASVVFQAFNPTIGDGSTLNVVSSTAGSSVTLTGVATGLVAPHVHINGSNFARSNAGVLVAPVYGTDPTFTVAPAGLTLPVGQDNFSIDGDITNAVSGTASTLRFNGSRALTLNAGQTLTVRTGTAGSDGGLLATGGASSISGGTGITTGGSGALIIRVNGSSDSLTINSPLTSGTSGGWTKSGAGTLALTSTGNAITGTISINEGTVRLGAANARLAAANATMTIRQGATLDLNGFTPGTATGQFNNNGTVTSTAGPANFTIGGTNSTGTSYGIIAGQVSVIKTGSGAQSWLGSSTYTGTTTIGSTGLVTVDTLADGNSPSGIGQSSNAAANLVFNGTTGGLVYQGNVIDSSTTQVLGSRSASTDRLFTLATTGTAASGATISSTVSNNNAIIWTNTGAIVNNTTTPATLVFGGTSLGDNTFNPQLVNSSVALGVNKTGAGQWNLGNAANSYTGITRVTEGVLALNSATALPANSPLVLGNTTTTGILQASGTFARNLTTTPTAGTGNINFGGTTGGGGFAAHGGPLTVTLDGGSGVTWGAGGFVGTGGVQTLTFGSGSTLSDVTFTNAINLGTAVRTISVVDNPNTGADYATLSGVLSVGGTSGSLLKVGTGILRLTGANTYSGTTEAREGILVVSSLGNSANPGQATGVGLSTDANLSANRVILGRNGNNAGGLQYVGAGETSDRLIDLAVDGGTGGSQIYADGSGPLVLTNVQTVGGTAPKTLFLRGSNTGGNMITSLLTNAGTGAALLNVTVDSGATWILTNSSNSYTGTTTASGGALGIGSDTAIGGNLVNTNGNIFAYGGDRTIANQMTLANNATWGFLGDYSLTFNTPILGSSANSNTLLNSIVDGKALTFNNMVANALTANRTMTIDGPGLTAFTGTFTSTSTAGTFGVSLLKTGNGTLELGTAGISDYNRNNADVDVDRGTLRFTANNAIPSTPTSGGLLITPEVLTGDTATIDLNGTSQTVNTFTAITDGTVVLDNSSAGPATLVVGANNTNATFGTGGVGTYSITQSGGGAINLTKTGTGNANFTGTLGNTGTVTGNGGVLNINSVSVATGAVADGGTINFKGGFTTPALTTLTTDNGGLVSFADGTGTPFNVTNLNLSLTANAALELDAGDTGTDTITAITATVNPLTTTTLFIKDIDLSNASTYDLILNAGGALGTSANYSLSLAGYTGSFLTVTGTAVVLNTGTLNLTDMYWAGATSPATTAWNTVDGGGNTNFSDDSGGAIIAQALPGKGQKVIFQADNITGGAPLATTLEQAFTVGSLEFRPSTTPADTSRTTSIAPGAVSSNSLTIRGSDGINLTAGASGSVTISAPLVAAVDQTWTVADAPVELLAVTSSAGLATLTVTSTAGLTPGMALTGSGIPAGTTIVSMTPTTITMSGTATATSTAASFLGNQQLNVTGALTGSGDVTKAGPGTVVLSGANGNLTGAYINSNGRTLVNTLSALGGQVGVPGSGTDITVTGGAFLYNNGTAGTFVNDITLNGGTLSAGGNGHTYSGGINVTADSIINMRDLATSTTFGTTSRAITLSGVVTGSSAITVDSVTTVTGGNQVTGNLVLNNASSTWNGDLNMTRGKVFFQNAAGGGNLTPYFGYNGEINFNQFGAVEYRNIDGGTLNRTAAINFASSAFGEIVVNNLGALASDYTLTQSGLISLNGTSVARVNLADAASSLIISGGINLNGNASLSVIGGDADSLVTITGTGFTGTGNLAINDEQGAWTQTSTRLRIDAASTFVGNTTLNEGILILGNKDALSTGSLTITGASTVQAGITLTGASSVANPVTQSANLTVSGSNSLELTGAFTGMGTDAARTLTNSLTGGATLAISGTSTNMNLASVASTSARVLTIAGAGNTSISQVINNGNSQANGITKTGSGTLTLSNTNLYTGTTTLSSAAATNNGIILATASNALGTGNFTSVMSDAVTSIGQLQLSGGITLANSFTTSGVGSDGTDSGIIRSISGDNIISGLVNLTGGGGASTYRADTGASLTFTNTIGAVGGQTDRIINLVGGGDFVFDNVIRNFNDANVAGTTGLNSSNTGTTTLNALNIYTRATTVGAGSTLIAGSTQAFGIGSAATVTGTLRLAGNNNSIGSITGAGIIENANATAATLTVGTNNTSTNFSGGIQDGTGGGALALTKTGSGTTTLSGTNTYTGQTTISAGILAVSGGSAIANTGTVQIDNVAGATLRLDSNETIGVLSGGGATGGVLNLQANTLTVGSGTFSGAINGTGGGLTKTGTGTLLLDGGVANGFTGVTTVSAGNLNLSRSTTNSTILGNVTIDGGTLNILSNEQIANTSIITQTSGAFRLNGRTETIGTYNKSGGSFSTGIGGKLFLLGNTWTENGGVSTIDAEGAINDANVNILNGGTIEVYGSNNASYSPGPFGTFGGELQVITGGTGLNFGAGSNAVNLESDATAADVGKLVLSSSITTTGAGSSLITSVGAGAVKGIVDLNAGTRTIDTAASNNLTVSAVITNGGITKEGAGSLILTEANTYNLGTEVNTGTLLVNNTTGSGTGTGGVTIDSGATLGGTGIIAPTVNNASVSVQGLLNVGNAGTGEDLVIDMSGATGTLVIDLTGGVTLDYFSGQGTGVLNTGLSFNDQLGIVGGGAALNLGGNLTFTNFNNLAANTFTAGSSWKLFAWTGVTTSGAFSNITGTIGNFTGFTDLSGELLGWDFTNLYTTGIVSIVAIPEPSRAMLLLLGLLSLGFRRRRNRF